MQTYFVVHPKGLVAREEGGRLIRPAEHELRDWGISLDEPHTVGERQGAEVVALAFEGEVPAPFAPMALRTLARFLDADSFKVAGRALHVMDWATTSRFCGRCGMATERVPHE